MRKHRRLLVESLETRELCATLPSFVQTIVNQATARANNVKANVAALVDGVRTITAAQDAATAQIATEEAQLATSLANSIQYNLSGRSPATLYAQDYNDAIGLAVREQLKINAATLANLVKVAVNPASAASYVQAEKNAIAQSLSAVRTRFNSLENQLSSNANVILAGNWAGTWTFLRTNQYNIQFKISVSQTGALTASGTGTYPVTQGNNVVGTTNITFTNVPLTFNNTTRQLSCTINGTSDQFGNPPVQLSFVWDLSADNTTLSQAVGSTAPSIVRKQP